MSFIRNITEGLEFGDLKGLVKSTITVDLHKPKIGSEEDTVVVAFSVLYEEPAKDLGSFIETDSIDHLDVEVSSVPDKDGQWKVFVEFQRDHKLFNNVRDMLESIGQAVGDNNVKWMYDAYRLKKSQEFSKENFKSDIIDSRYEYKKTYLDEPSESSKALDSIEEKWTEILAPNG